MWWASWINYDVIQWKKNIFLYAIKVNPKWFQNHNERPEITKPLEEDIGIHFDMDLVIFFWKYLIRQRKQKQNGNKEMKSNLKAKLWSWIINKIKKVKLARRECVYMYCSCVQFWNLWMVACQAHLVHRIFPVQEYLRTCHHFIYYPGVFQPNQIWVLRRIVQNIVDFYRLCQIYSHLYEKGYLQWRLSGCSVVKIY